MVEHLSGETIPIRVFLGGFDLTPTFRDVNKKFTTRYYLNLVLIDEENRRYFKQQVCLPLANVDCVPLTHTYSQEITIFRIPEVCITELLLHSFRLPLLELILFSLVVFCILYLIATWIILKLSAVMKSMNFLKTLPYQDSRTRSIIP